MVQSKDTAMKPAFTALALALTIAVAPAQAFSLDISGMFPTLTFPEPAPQPVTQGDAGIDK